ncbi:ATP-grasp domain-containing protein [Halioglobus sp.]|nr:ATP-grasp domain-containing protein [Halioglobus sp.]
MSKSVNRFTSVLVANRGEIACRVIRSAQEQGYRTIAVYSDIDAGAPHVVMADDAILIGPGPANESYLLTDSILMAARTSGAGAIHPGYGFLSENAMFAAACESAGLVFIGPDPGAIRLMGNKAEAKRRMIAAGVPCVPGYEGEQQDNERLLAEGLKIDLPLMVKASAGGGGRGMRLVEHRDEMARAINLARTEALSAFGDDELILEKAIVRPRHVEVQVFGDSQGNIVHLGERDCSVQRRHQKVVEEAPCPVMTDTLREAMGAAAVAAARSINYRGAGTVEFLLDEHGAFYFLEMNTRLQVEHPVTELITGRDLVALQLQVAQGEPLGFSQSDVTLSGHAIEVRLYTEDPAQEFLPTAGPVALWSPPSGTGVRVDDGIRSGQEISPFYDPMVAKIIATGPNRETARLRLMEALRNTVLFGPTHNRDFLLACLEKPRFAAGQATTAFIDEEFTEDELVARPPSLAESAAAAVLEIELQFRDMHDHSVLVAPQLRDWSSASPLVYRKHYQHGEQNHDLSISPLGQQCYRVTGDDEEVLITLLSVRETHSDVLIDNRRHALRYYRVDETCLYVSIDGRTAAYRDLIQMQGSEETAAGSGNVVAPMHGMLQELRVDVGDEVSVGQPLAVLEAMKMHYEIVAEVAGKVSQVLIVAGTQVSIDELLIKIEIEVEPS